MINTDVINTTAKYHKEYAKQIKKTDVRIQAGVAHLRLWISSKNKFAWATTPGKFYNVIYLLNAERGITNQTQHRDRKLYYHALAQKF